MKPENLLPFEGEVYFYPSFFMEEEANQLFQELTSNISWKQEPITIMGKQVMQPRLTAWYGDPGKSYSYSGITMNPIPWNDTLSIIKTRIEKISNREFNSALLNFYRHGNDSMGWHRDNEKSLGKNPIIASVSFGTIRKFALRYAQNARTKVELQLTHGSLLMMEGSTQHHWYHCVPKQKKITTPRLNITFRKILV